MDVNQALWDVIREETRISFGGYAGGGPREWTRIRTAAAKKACRRFAEFSGRDVEVGTELWVKHRKYRLDVYARENGPIAEEFFVALETELAPWGWNGVSEKDWRKAFRRLCFVKAEFRVVMGTFEGAGNSFDRKLPGYLDTLKAEFDAREPGRFLLAFGPENSKKMPTESWRAFSLDPDFRLLKLNSDPAFIPYQVIPWYGGRSSVLYT